MHLIFAVSLEDDEGSFGVWNIALSAAGPIFTGGRLNSVALTRYDGGRASYFEVLEAQQQLYPAQAALAQTQLDQLIATVNLYKALGGGWRATDAQWLQPE